MTWTLDARTVHYGLVDIYDVMRTTAAVRDYTDDPLPDDVLERILDNARFAPSGGNRQGTRVVVIRDRADPGSIGGVIRCERATVCRPSCRTAKAPGTRYTRRR